LLSLTIVGVEDGVLMLETTGTDPYIFCGMIDNAALVWAAQHLNNYSCACYTP